MASEVTKRLRDRRLNIWNECKGLAEGAASENRSFSAEEQGKWDVMQEEMRKLDERIKSALDAEARAREADAAFDKIGQMEKRPATEDGQQAAVDSKKLNDQIRSFLRGDAGAPRAIDIPRPDNSLLARMNYGPINYRTLTTSVTTAGGNLVPTDFYDQLIAHLIEVSGILQAGPTVLNTAGGENLQIPKTTAHTAAASAAQAGTLPTADPAFGLVTLSAYKYGVLIQVARELLDDSAVDLIGYLAMSCGRALGNKFGSDLVTGVGGGQPTGLIQSSSVAITGTTTGVSGRPAYADLVNMEYSVIAPYRQSKSCYWLAADKTIGSFRLITDNQGRPIWEPSMVLGSPDLLLGKPLVADPFMPALVTSNKMLAFGDFSQFFVRIVGPVRFERSDDFLFGSDLVAFRALIRGDGTLVDQTGAIKLYQGAAT